jgi:hypothetical protein
MTIEACVAFLEGRVCRSIIAGSGTGSVVNFGFGCEVLRKQPLRNTALSEDDRKFGSELELMVYCAWRISKAGEVQCAWRDSNEQGGDMLAGLYLLKGRRVLGAHIGALASDLNIYLEDEFLLQIFCDLTNDYDADYNYVFYRDDSCFTVGLKGVRDV